MATAQQCIDRVKWQVDLASAATGGRLVDTELLPFVNLAYREAWDILVGAYEDYFVKLNTTPASTFTLAGGASGNSYQITATDFYKVKGVQWQVTGDRWSNPLPTFEFNEWGGPDYLSYRQEFDTLYFEPNESLSGKTFRLWYVYKPADLALGDTLVDVNGWVEPYVIDTVAIRCQHREEEDASTLVQLRSALQQRIEKMAANRNAGKGRKVARTRRGRGFRFMTRSGIPLP